MFLVIAIMLKSRTANYGRLMCISGLQRVAPKSPGAHMIACSGDGFAEISAPSPLALFEQRPSSDALRCENDPGGLVNRLAAAFHSDVTKVAQTGSQLGSRLAREKNSALFFAASASQFISFIQKKPFLFQ